MKRIITILINILLLPVTLFIFFMPILIYFMPLMNEGWILIIGSMLFILWLGVFLSSIIFLSSYCGFLCPVTKLFDLLAYITKDERISKHRFPKIVGKIVPILWIGGILYVFIRFIGNIFGFLPREPIYSHIELLALISLYGIAVILLKTDIGKDELGHYLCPLSPFIKAGIEVNTFLKIPGFNAIKRGWSKN